MNIKIIIDCNSIKTIYGIPRILYECLLYWEIEKDVYIYLLHAQNVIKYKSENNFIDEFVLSCSSNYINKKEVIEKFIKPIFDNKSAEELMRLNMYEK